MADTRRLTVEPTAGLANRLRVIDAAIGLSRELGSALRIVWTRTPDLGCRFDELFEPIRGIQIAERSWPHSRIVRHVGGALKYRVLAQPEIERLMAARHDFTRLDARYPYLITCSQFFPSSGHLQDLTPVAAIAARVREAAGRFTPSTVGVHIRRTDNAAAIARSPTASFIAAMSALVREDPGTNFFVSTDDPAEEATLRGVFGDRILTLPKRLNRADPEAVKSALVDLLCLSRNRLILGSHWSSFSEVAAEMGPVPLRVIDTEATPPLEP